MDLEFEKYCTLDGSPSPTTVLLSPIHQKLEKMISRERSFSNSNYLFRSEDYFTHTSVDDDEDLLRRSSSNMQKPDSGKERTKIEFSRDSAAAFSFGIVDALCGLDDDYAASSSPAAGYSSGRRLGKNLHPDLFNLNAAAAMLPAPHSPFWSENSGSRASSSSSSSPKAVRFGPMKRPFGKRIKSPRKGNSVLGNLAAAAVESGVGVPPIWVTPPITESVNGAKRDFSNMASCLQGVLKLEKKRHGFIQFSVPFSEEDTVFVAEEKRNSGYEFRSLPSNNRKNEDNHYRFKEPSSSFIVGHMRMSCRIKTKLKHHPGVCNNNDNNFFVMEFVLYDMRENGSFLKSLYAPSPDDVLSGTGNIGPRKKAPAPAAIHNDDPPLELRPELELAAIVIELPFALKNRNWCENKLLRSEDDACCEYNSNNNGLSHVKMMNVVLPSAGGRHSLPTTESREALHPLIDRWRLGGGCDCGGWDLACPLRVFDITNAQIGNDDDSPLINNHKPFELFLQGKKGKAPALTMMALTDDGQQYAVSFQHELSVLQAFSICVSVLHTTEALAAGSVERRRGKNVKSLQQRMFANHDFGSLTVGVRQQEKAKGSRKVDQSLPLFVVNPLFSSIARI
ncbi:unnamed protein product [Cuscuta epithymum]|uniref:DUF3527 domain protein n=1 Tax=Cuscuta epithymum TaxID=186058 RepID=A0AAV0G3V9_9ASTE|nr:unnamed protein product [Cuscuta epithymum]CAH9142613.1 unnamed protein product [Cuscuta epithymum]